MKQSFSKKERLSSKKIIDSLFQKGRGKTKEFFLYPFRVLYQESLEENNQPSQVLVSVSKRYFKRAVDRNLIKRRIREGYRTNKSGIVIPPVVAFVYIAKEIEPYSLIEKKIKRSIDQLSNEKNT